MGLLPAYAPIRGVDKGVASILSDLEVSVRRTHPCDAATGVELMSLDLFGFRALQQRKEERRWWDTPQTPRARASPPFSPLPSVQIRPPACEVAKAITFGSPLRLFYGADTCHRLGSGRGALGPAMGAVALSQRVITFVLHSHSPFSWA